MDPIAAFQEYEQAALSALKAAADTESLEAARIEFLGKKKGRLRALQDSLAQAPQEQRPELGRQFNEVKNKVSEAWEQRKQELEKPKAQQTSDFDITLPGVPLRLGRKHPITQTMEEFKDIMGRFGFSIAEGPELEDEYHNFVALNIPEEHPARDPLDNFYLATADAATRDLRTSDRTGQTKKLFHNIEVANARSVPTSDRGCVMLRSQTSTVQIRVMERTKPPVRIVSLGRVYRPDTMDATHSCMFHQMEGLMIGESVTMAELKTVLRLFATAYLGADVHIRFRPSFFPFTEPSVEVDMSWQGDWLELGGAGMVDPNVLKAVGYAPEAVSGFAFGLGIERFCMRRHQITDIRRLYENNVRFLEQF